MQVPDASDRKRRKVDGVERKLDIVRRRIRNQNVFHRIQQREIHKLKPGTPWHVTRDFYKNIFPNFTVVNVEKPPCFLRKFSPDGRHFLAFSADQTSVEIFEFKGCDAAENLLSSVSSDVMHEKSSRLQNPAIKAFYDRVKEQLFATFFKRKHLVPVATEGQHLNRECSLFTEDSRYVIVSAACHTRQEPRPAFSDIYTNNESISPNPRSPLENYTLHVVNIKTGVLCFSREFNCDKIFPSHNQGLYLYRNTLAILSVQHQTIYIFQVTNDGELIETNTIGRFCFDDDQFVLSNLRDPAAEEALRMPYAEKPINSLKHRILVHLYKQAEKQGREHVRRFHQHFEFLCSLRMWKMQLLDENHLLIKYASEDVVSSRVQEPGAQPSFFVTYNIPDAKVLAVYENTSCDLLSIFERHPDLFRPPGSPADTGNPGQPGGAWQQQAAAAANVHTLKIQKRFKETIINAKYGGHTEAIKRLLAQLPVPAQSHNCSPYLDLSLFSYDDKWISSLERPKSCGDHPIRFYARDSGILKFRIYAGKGGSHPATSSRRLVAFTFHPFEPFAISVQRTSTDYVVNFHFRHARGADG
uniref:DET1 homolog n=1 Tax=Styela clava TaxID=7725 RepID=UPI001939819F|nr:DET1 homolog [Styela clava]